MVVVSFNEWLLIPNKYLWRIVEENDSAGNKIARCTAFGSDLKQVFRNLGKTLLGMHKRCHFDGNLLNHLRINTVDNTCVVIEKTRSGQGRTWIEKMEADIIAFITMFNKVCSDSPPSWNNTTLSLPPDADYLNQVYCFFRRPTNYRDFRFMEFWTFNYPGFLSFGRQQYFFYIIYDLKYRDEGTFNTYVTLRSLVNWQRKITQDDEGYLDKVYKYNPHCPNANPPVIRGLYKKSHGILNFARNCYQHYRPEQNLSQNIPHTGNRIQIAQKIQDIYPDLMGTIHYELLNFPSENGDINLHDHLVAGEGGEQETYTWG